MSVKITCINKDNGNHENPYVAISHLGWTNEHTGASGKCTREAMYEFVTEGNDAYVVDPYDGSKAFLEGRISVNKNPYVRTIANDTGRDNLLSLFECLGM